MDANLRKKRGFNSQLIKFLYRQRITGFDVPTSPHFDSDETTTWFVETLKRSTMYLEYGSGGSTFLAAQLGIPFVTVDSDPYFLSRVRRQIELAGLLRSNQTYHYADIGLTGPWGWPVRPWAASTKKVLHFAEYSDPPLHGLREQPGPDFILIDGRFRVACTLKCLKMLSGAAGWKIMVDDYAGRPQYGVIEEFSTIDQFVGRAAILSSVRTKIEDSLAAAIRRFETVPD
jgi:hypothetical protein